MTALRVGETIKEFMARLVADQEAAAKRAEEMRKWEEDYRRRKLEERQARGKRRRPDLP